MTSYYPVTYWDFTEVESQFGKYLGPLKLMGAELQRLIRCLRFEEVVTDINARITILRTIGQLVDAKQGYEFYNTSFNKVTLAALCKERNLYTSFFTSKDDLIQLLLAYDRGERKASPCPFENFTREKLRSLLREKGLFEEGTDKELALRLDCHNIPVALKHENKRPTLENCSHEGCYTVYGPITVKGKLEKEVPPPISEEEECVICLHQPRSMISVPCGHYSFCPGCCLKLTSCPRCGAPGVKFIRVHK